MKAAAYVALALVTALVAAAGLQAQEQEIVKEALQFFPAATVHLEYSSPEKLRKLPNYTSLRQRYLGAQLQKIEQALGKLGVQENDIDELVLGWSAGGGKIAELYGLAEGRFDAPTVAKKAAAEGLKPALIALDLPAAYCLPGSSSFGSGATCVTVLSDSEGAFGDLKELGSVLRARSRQAMAAGLAEHLKSLVSEDKSDAPIWGVAVQPAITEWFKSSMPGQESLQLDWSQTFSGVQALGYSINAADQVHLDLRLDCATPEAAMSLRQLLDGLKGFQQLAWPSQHPNEPNPFQQVEVDSEGQRVNLKLTTPYPAS